MTAATERPLRAAPDTDGQDPHDIAAEQAVLGAAILKPDLIPELAGILRDDDWYRPAHGTIWATITELHATGNPVDEITIHDQLLRTRQLNTAGGVLYLHELVENTLEVHAATYHARIVAERAHQRRTRELGTWLQQAAHTGTDPDTIRERINTHLNDRNPAQRAASSTWAPVDIDAVLNGTGEDPTPTIATRNDGHGLLYPAAVHLLSGEPESGKTWIALHAATQQMQAGNNVAYLDFEDRPARVTARLLAIGATPDQLRRHLRYIRPNEALAATGHTALQTAVTGTTLTILDGVTEAMALHGLDLSSNPDIATFYDLLPRRLTPTGTAVLLIDHVVKDPEKQGRWGIGGQHKLAGIDGAAYTVKVVEPFGRGKHGKARITLSKDRHGHVSENALGRTAAEFHLDSTQPNISTAQLAPAEPIPQGETGQIRPTFLMEKVSRWLEIRPGQALNAVKAAKLGKTAYVLTALEQLVVEGHVEVEHGPRNALLHRVTTPYRKDEQDDA